MSASLDPLTTPVLHLTLAANPLFGRAVSGACRQGRNKKPPVLFSKESQGMQRKGRCGGTSSARLPGAVPATLRTDAPPGFQRTEVSEGACQLSRRREQTANGGGGQGCPGRLLELGSPWSQDPGPDPGRAPGFQ